MIYASRMRNEWGQLVWGRFRLDTEGAQAWDHYLYLLLLTLSLIQKDLVPAPWRSTRILRWIYDMRHHFPLRIRVITKSLSAIFFSLLFSKSIPRRWFGAGSRRELPCLSIGGGKGGISPFQNFRLTKPTRSQDGRRRGSLKLGSTDRDLM